MFGRRRTSRAQARRDREWRRFVRDLTEPASQVSPAEDDRLRAFLAREGDGAHRHGEAEGHSGPGPAAERAA